MSVRTVETGENTDGKEVLDRKIQCFGQGSVAIKPGNVSQIQLIRICQYLGFLYRGKFFLSYLKDSQNAGGMVSESAVGFGQLSPIVVQDEVLCFVHIDDRFIKKKLIVKRASVVILAIHRSADIRPPA